MLLLFVRVIVDILLQIRMPPSSRCPLERLGSWGQAVVSSLLAQDSITVALPGYVMVLLSLCNQLTCQWQVQNNWNIAESCFGRKQSSESFQAVWWRGVRCARAGSVQRYEQCVPFREQNNQSRQESEGEMLVWIIIWTRFSFIVMSYEDHIKCCYYGKKNLLRFHTKVNLPQEMSRSYLNPKSKEK